jgi:hypothetical protein
VTLISSWSILHGFHTVSYLIVFLYTVFCLYQVQFIYLLFHAYFILFYCVVVFVLGCIWPCLAIVKHSVLRRVFGPNTDDVTGEWRKLHNEELHNLYSSPDIISQVKANETGGACGTHGRREKSVRSYKVLEGKPEGKR